MTLAQRILFVGAHCDDVELFERGMLHAVMEALRDEYDLVVTLPSMAR